MAKASGGKTTAGGPSARKRSAEQKPGEDAPSEGFWDRHDVKLKRFALVFGIFTGVVSLLVLAISQFAGGGPKGPLTADQQRLIDSIPPLVGSRCRVVDIEPRTSRVSQEMDELTSAYVTCAPSIDGPRSLWFRGVTTETDTKTLWQKIYGGPLNDSTGGCSGGYEGATQWVDASGFVAGELACHTAPNNSGVFWTDRRRLYVGIAQMAPGKHAPLYEWWQKAVRFEGSGPDPEAQRKLRSLLPPDFASCTQHPRMPAVAIAGLACEPGRGIWSAGAALVPNARLLAEYIEARAAAISDRSDKGCRDSTRSFTIYGQGSDARPVQGRLLCHADDGVQWFEWTATRPHVYAYLSRADESLTRLFHQWSTSFADVEGLPYG
jgi:hypothetical protein